VAPKERILFQPYVAGRRGSLQAGQAVLCRNVDEAGRRAEKAMEGGRVLGAHIVRTMDDEATGEFGIPEYLSQFGRVPDRADEG
jgi:hypothetical protein